MSCQGVKRLVTTKSKMATPYAYFQLSLAPKNPNILQILQNEVNVSCDHRADICAYKSTSAWVWTIPGAYKKAIHDSFSSSCCEGVLEKYFNQLYFSASCGLPTAPTKEHVDILYSNTKDWVTLGLPLDTALAAVIPTDLKEAIFNSSINLLTAMTSLSDTANHEWATINWLTLEAREHALSSEVQQHIEKVIFIKKSAEKLGKNVKICIHNMLVSVTGTSIYWECGEYACKNCPKI